MPTKVNVKEAMETKETDTQKNDIPCHSGWPQTFCIAQASLMILLSQPPNVYNDSHVLLHLAQDNISVLIYYYLCVYKHCVCKSENN